MKRAFRFLIAVALFGALFLIVDFNELVKTFVNVEWKYIVYLLLLSVALVWLSCLKWRLFIRAGGHDMPILRLMKFYTIGYFFNIFTPSYVGGDVARSYHLGKQLNNQKDAFVATFLERFTGLVAMSLLGMGSVLLGSEVAAGIEVAILIVGAGALFLTSMVFSKKVGDLAIGIAVAILHKVAPAKLAHKLESLINKIAKAIDVARGDYLLLMRALWLSFCFHTAGVFNTYLAARAIGWENPEFGALFVVVPLVLLVGMIPITPSGLGLTEGAFLFFLMRIGASETQAFGVGILLRAKVMLVALFGGLLLLTVREATKKPAEDSAAESAEVLDADKRANGL